MSVEKVTIGPHAMYLGDCRDILPTLGKVDAVVTDPPYGIALSDHSKGGRYGKPRKTWELGIAGDANQAIGIAVLQWAADNHLPTVAFASPKLPWPGKWRSLLVWDKGPTVGGGGDTQRCWKQAWELIQVARNGPLRGSRDGSVLRYWVTWKLSQDHPAAKPISLMKYLVEKITDSGQTILDPFMGSGTTGVACVRTSRTFIGIEKEREYFDIAVKRISDEINRYPMLEPEQKTRQMEFTEDRPRT